jgi:uncharacterized repeat protein (TIGR03803 family)
MKKTILTLGFIVAAYMLNAQVLYGTTSLGGNNNGGTICKFITATNTLSAAFSFEGADGATPEYLKLIQASDGTLYGMTRAGGNAGAGTIFSYDPSNATYAKLKDFDYADNDGYSPSGSLIQASDGKLYGMTSSGGENGWGVIFSYDPATSVYTNLIDFDGINGGVAMGSLIQASDGKLYGMTNRGGTSDFGVIFSFDHITLTYIKLKDFNNATGVHPYGCLLQAFDGKLYGMTQGDSYWYIPGNIFSFDPATATYTTVQIEENYGGYPYGSLIQASDGKLYGMTNAGGRLEYGSIFSLDPVTLTYTRLLSFDTTDAYYPHGDLVQASDGKLYGMTPSGGSSDAGVIFSFDPVTSAYTKLEDFDDSNGRGPKGTLVQTSDGKFYGVTSLGGSTGYSRREGAGVIFSFDPLMLVYTKLWDFGTNNTGNYIAGALIKDQANKLYGMTSEGGSYGAGTIFSFDEVTAVFTKLKDFDFINGANPYGNLLQASDLKFYGMTPSGGDKDYGVIFSYDPATSAYIKLKDFDNTNGSSPSGSLIQAFNGKLYGMTSGGGGANGGVIFSYDPATSAYTKLIDFDGTNGRGPAGSLTQASDGKLYGMTTGGGRSGNGVIFSFDPSISTYTKLMDFNGINGKYPLGSLIQVSDGNLYGMTHAGGNNDSGVIFSYNPAALTYTKLKDFNSTNGAYPHGSFIQASDGKLYGMTSRGGSNNYGVVFSYDPATSTYTKRNDFTGDNGSNPEYTSFIEMPEANVQISILDKSIIEGNRDRKFLFVPVIISEKFENIIRVHYSTQNNTATAGSDYVAQSGTVVFPSSLKKIMLPIRIIGDQTPEANETFSIVLSNPVNATIADSTAIVTILNDDASALNASMAKAETTRAIRLSPNPAQDKVNIMLTGYTGNVILQLSNSDGRILQQQKLNVASAKLMQQQINVGSYANGTYLVTAIDEKGNRQTESLIVDR